MPQSARGDGHPAVLNRGAEPGAIYKGTPKCKPEEHQESHGMDA